jgi:hypothetical protein
MRISEMTMRGESNLTLMLIVGICGYFRSPRSSFGVSERQAKVAELQPIPPSQT